MTIERSGAISALVITCIDFRLIAFAETYLNTINYRNNYDEFILAGASLGYNTNCNKITLIENSTQWTDLLDDHILISNKLHKISEIIVIDHMDCGAYKHQLNKGNKYEIYDEIKAHVEQLNTFRKTINEKYTKDEPKIPKYTVKLLLMKLNGKVDINPTYWRPNDVVRDLNKNARVEIESISDVFSTIPKENRKYRLYQLDLSETNIIFAKVYEENGIWYLENPLNGYELREQTGYSSWMYYLKLENSLAYIEVRLNFVLINFSFVFPYVRFSFHSVDYFNASRFTP